MILNIVIGYFIIGIICSIITNKLNTDVDIKFSWSFSLFVILAWLPILILILISCVFITENIKDEHDYFE